MSACMRTGVRNCLFAPRCWCACLCVCVCLRRRLARVCVNVGVCVEVCVRACVCAVRVHMCAYIRACVEMCPPGPGRQCCLQYVGSHAALASPEHVVCFSARAIEVRNLHTGRIAGIFKHSRSTKVGSAAKDRVRTHAHKAGARGRFAPWLIRRPHLLCCAILSQPLIPVISTDADYCHRGSYVSCAPARTPCSSPRCVRGAIRR